MELLYHINSYILVSLASSLNPKVSHLFLTNLNSLQYNLASPEPTSLLMAIPASYQETRSAASTPNPDPSPSTTLSPINTRNYWVAGVHNDKLDRNLLLPPVCNLSAFCAAFCKANTEEWGSIILPISDSVKPLCLYLQIIVHFNSDCSNRAFHHLISSGELNCVSSLRSCFFLTNQR